MNEETKRRIEAARLWNAGVAFDGTEFERGFKLLAWEIRQSRIVQLEILLDRLEAHCVSSRRGAPPFACPAGSERPSR